MKVSFSPDTVYIHSGTVLLFWSRPIQLQLSARVAIVLCSRVPSYSCLLTLEQFSVLEYQATAVTHTGIVLSFRVPGYSCLLTLEQFSVLELSLIHI